MPPPVHPLPPPPPPMTPFDAQKTSWRYPLMASAIMALITGLWSGLFRMGWAIDVVSPSLPMAHGPLMICGFLGTLISLERAVALDRWWAYTAPAAAGLGGILLIVGVGTWQGPLLITLASVMLAAIFVAVLLIQAQTFVFVMMLGAVSWLVGNAFWLLGQPVFIVVHWWIGFLVVTIAGERLELSRMLLHGPGVQRLFLGIAAVFVTGMIVASVARDAGMRLTGTALVALALWLYYYDVARHTIRQTGLTRFIAVCLLAGYVWLGAGGLLAIGNGGVIAGPVYDALLHAVFVGFVFSMIFGHAPIIFPSVLGTPLFYRPFFYAHVVLLHLSLVLRMVGDLGGGLYVRQWGGMLNAVAILLFLGSTIASVLVGRATKLKAGS